MVPLAEAFKFADAPIQMDEICVVLLGATAVLFTVTLIGNRALVPHPELACA